MNYEEMSDFEINAAVTNLVYGCDGWELNWTNNCFFHCGIDGSGYYRQAIHNYCNNPSDAWPIIIENKISIHHDIARYSADSLVYSKRFDDGFKIFRHEGKMGDTSSRAALRSAIICYLKMKDEDNINPHKEQITDIVGEEKL